MIRLSVIIPAYFPPPEQIGPVLDALRKQTLPRNAWELVIVDNRTVPPLDSELVAWHPNGRLVREERPGTTAARLAGAANSSGALIVFVDQDNILAPDFLATALRIAVEHPQLGTWGAGIITPRFERPETAPPPSLHSLLTLRSAAQDQWSNDPNHHDSTPWGAGFCVRRTVLTAYAKAVRADERRGALDLCGERRFASGDTDIAYVGCDLGWGKGVFRALRLEHIIPASRCTENYLCKNAEDRGYSDILHHLVRHGRLPTLRGGPLEKLRRLLHGRSISALERAVQRATWRGRARALAELSAAETKRS
ncbi:MAG: family 2 glycosyl transferase [Opitutus sp.]|nr:family 2 glycosyl transferase [Opitutus sp.]